MRLTPQEVAALLPLLRPNVEVEIVLHETKVKAPPDAVAPYPLPDLTPKGKRRGRQWTEEQKQARRDQIAARKQAAAAEPPKDVNAQQASVFRVAAQAARAGQQEVV